MKCSEVLQYSDGLSNKVSDIIRRHNDNMKREERIPTRCNNIDDLSSIVDVDY